MKKTKTTEYDQRDYIITGATIKDGKCDYSYRVTEGNGVGDTHNVKGVGIHDDDLGKAFGKLNAHMALIDDAFKNSNEEVGKITGKIHNHILTALYGVGGFNIKGDENESVILTATKQISCSGETDQVLRASILAKFKAGKIRCVINVGVLTTGFDYPELETVLIARGTMSLALYYQIVGRAMRPHAEKESAWIVDLGGNVNFFGKIETMRIEQNDRGQYFISNNGRQLTNVAFQKN